jgi:uncharacterized protein (DUF433 family)
MLAKENLMSPSVVTDPNTANGQPIFSGTQITVAEVLEQLASGEDIATISRTRGGKLSPVAVAEAVRLAARALLENAVRYVPAASAPAPAPTPAPAPAPKPAPASGAGGVTGQLALAQPDKLTYVSNERISFHMTVTNSTSAPVKYSYLGVKVVNLDTGADEQFHTSWSGDDKSIPANGTGPLPGGWDDGLAIGPIGHYRLTLNICLGTTDQGRQGVGWQTLTPGMDITIGELAAGAANVTTLDGAKVYTSHGVVANAFWVEKDTVGTDEPVWFHFKVTNPTAEPVPFSILAARAEEGQAAQSWTNQKLAPGQVLEWRDHINFKQAGTYHLYLGIGYANKDDCVAMRAPWDRLSDSVKVTVQ